MTGQVVIEAHHQNQIAVQKSVEGHDTSDETENHNESKNFIPHTDKEMIYNNWTNAVIIKIFGRKVSYSFLQNKIMAIWKPTESITLIDLGYNYYLIKFLNPENYDKALHGGPWFIGK